RKPWRARHAGRDGCPPAAAHETGRSSSALHDATVGEHPATRRKMPAARGRTAVRSTPFVQAPAAALARPPRAPLPLERGPVNKRALTPRNPAVDSAPEHAASDHAALDVSMSVGAPAPSAGSAKTSELAFSDDPVSAYTRVRAQTCRLCDPLELEDHGLQSMP